MKNKWKLLLLILYFATLSITAFAQTGYEGEGVPELASTIGIAIICAVAGGIVGFKIAQKKDKK